MYKRPRYITPLEGLQQYLGEDTRVLYAEGCHLYKDKVQGLAEETDRFKEALIMAEQSDVVVMCLGLDATIEGEEGDAGNEYASGDKLGPVSYTHLDVYKRQPVKISKVR